MTANDLIRSALGIDYVQEYLENLLMFLSY